MNLSESYIWYDKSVIDCGNRATIYKGFHRFSGQFVAVKVNKSISTNNLRGYLSPIDDAEIRIIKGLSHKNLVEFIGIERLEESTDQSEFIGEIVLFFELCHGMNLESLLRSPMYRYGLPCEMFLELLSDLNEALRYLKMKNLFFTDVRTENIFQSFDSNGKQIFKLTDLKNARKLQSENSKSMKNKSKSLVSTSNCSDGELWTLAVTIFQCITGNFPIESFSTNSIDRVRLQRLFQTKPSKYLCGVELSENDEIQWSKTFPKSTRLPKTLQLIFEDLLINIFDIEPSWLITFDGFLDEIEQILHLTPIHYAVIDQFIFTVDYFSGETSIEEFFRQVQRETNLLEFIEYQIFFNNQRYFVQPTMTINEFCAQLSFQTSRDFPLILYPTSMTDCYRTSITSIYLPQLRQHISHNNILPSSIDLTNELLALIYFLKDFITNFDQTLRMIDLGLQMMHRYLKFKSLTLLSLIRQKCVDYEIVRQIEEISRNDEKKCEQIASVSVPPRRHRSKSLVQSIDNDDESSESDRPILCKANDFFHQLNSFEQQLTTLINENLNCQLFNEETLRVKIKANISSQNQRLDRQIQDATMFNKTFRISTTNPTDIQLSFDQIQRKYLENISQCFFQFFHNDCQEFVRDNFQRYSQRIRKQLNTFEEIEYFQLAYEELMNDAVPIDQIHQAIEHYLRSKISSKSLKIDEKMTKSIRETNDFRTISSFLVTYVDEDPLMDSIRSTFRTTIEEAKQNSLILQKIVEYLKTYSIEFPLE